MKIHSILSNVFKISIFLFFTWQRLPAVMSDAQKLRFNQIALTNLFKRSLESELLQIIRRFNTTDLQTAILEISREIKQEHHYITNDN